MGNFQEDYERVLFASGYIFNKVKPTMLNPYLSEGFDLVPGTLGKMEKEIQKGDWRPAEARAIKATLFDMGVFSRGREYTGGLEGVYNYCLPDPPPDWRKEFYRKLHTGLEKAKVICGEEAIPYAQGVQVGWLPNKQEDVV